MLTTLLFTLKIKFVLKIGELNGFFTIKQIETSSVSLHFFSTLVASSVLYNRTEHSQGFELVFLDFCCFLFPLGVLVNGIRKANQSTHLLSHQFRKSGHLT